MPPWLTGLLIGFTACLLLAGGLAVWAYQRFVVLRERARRAERLAELGTLTGGLAHEIKNPLSTIQLNLQLLEEDLPGESVVGARVINRLRTVRSEASRLRETLDDFLRYAGKMELEREPTDLNRLIDEIGDFFHPQAAVHGVKLRIDLAPKPIVANVDPKFVKQAVLNLMLNATQAMSGPDRAGGELIIQTRQLDGHAFIDVTDTGPGIDAERLPKIFEAYFTTKKGGTGLGLPMTRRIAEEHGGHVSVASEVGRGTKFTLKFPVGNIA
ncbi:MAG: ATP-binding protein [Tepidisphaeraceae bacterium]